MNRTTSPTGWAQNPDGTPGFTWNPITGCLNGCEYCYARKLANTRLKSTYLANSILPTHDEPDHEAHHCDPFFPRFWPGKLDQPLKRKKPAGIFTCDMSDLFGIDVPEQWTRSIFNFIQYCPQHRFYLLTKQPQNLKKFSPFPDNCWVGVTTTNPEMFGKAAYYLKDVKAQVKYLSFEPLLQSLRHDIDFEKRTAHFFEMAGISWVIIGAQTKPYKPPKMEWAEEIVEACDKAGIPIFEKENLRLMYAKGNNVHPNMIGLRQEMPK